MSTTYSMDIRWSGEDGAFVAVCSELGGVSALGETAVRAAAELEQAVALAVETYQEEGWALPDSRDVHPYSGQFRLRLPRSLHGWLVGEAQREGVSLNTYVVARLSGGWAGVMSLADPEIEPAR